MNEKKASPLHELTCTECRELLSSFVDRELDREDRHAVEEHLAKCDKCGSESGMILGMKNIVQHWGGVQGSGEWRRGVMEEFVRESRMMPSAPFNQAAQSARDQEQSEDTHRLSPAVVLGVAVALAAIAYLFMRLLLG